MRETKSMKMWRDGLLQQKEAKSQTAADNWEHVREE